MADELSFSQAWQMLQQNHDGLKASQLNKEEAAYLQEAETALYFPTIDVIGGYTHLSDDTRVSLAPSFQITEQDITRASLNMVWPVYTGGRITAVQDIAAGRFLEAEHLLRIKRQSLFETLTKYYFGVVLAKQVLITQIDAERRLFKHLRHAKKLEKQGQIPKDERLKVDASHARAKVEQRKAQQNLEIAEIALW